MISKDIQNKVGQSRLQILNAGISNYFISVYSLYHLNTTGCCNS